MKAYVDTTILTDVLLNSGDVAKAAETALSSFESTSLPVYAIKEFKAGPLGYFVYFHNKLVTLQSFQKAITALQRLSRTPQRNRLATSIQALEKGLSESFSKHTTKDMVDKYGANAQMDRVLYDELRSAINGIVKRAWRRRRKVTSEIVDPLDCYHEVGPSMKRGLLELGPCDCPEDSGCYVSRLMQKAPDKLTKMRDRIVDSTKAENVKRAKVLREMIRKPKTDITKNDCRNLGDAVFAFFAPEDSVILTTNIQDYQPLVDALGKTVQRP
jgi:hypothetical protein